MTNLKDINKKYRHWNFTSFNTELDHQEHLLGLPDAGECKYIIFGREVCPTTGRLHLQGFITFNNQVRRKTAWKILSMPPEEYTEGNETTDGARNWVSPITSPTTDAAIEYCKKEGNWSEAGEPVLTTNRVKGMFDLLDEWYNAAITLHNNSIVPNDMPDFVELVDDIYDELVDFAIDLSELVCTDVDIEDSDMELEEEPEDEEMKSPQLKRVRTENIVGDWDFRLPPSFDDTVPFGFPYNPKY